MKGFKKVPKCDILLIGLNVSSNPAARTYRINEDFHNSYYKYISWFKKL